MTKTNDPLHGFTAEEKVRLIAAAPALLDACNSIMCACEDMELDDIGALEDVRAAIELYEGVPYIPSNSTVPYVREND